MNQRDMYTFYARQRQNEQQQQNMEGFNQDNDTDDSLFHEPREESLAEEYRDSYINRE